MSAGSASGKSTIVTLVVVAMLVSGSLAVALPLSSPDNNSTDPKLKMYHDPSGTIELEKKDGLYVVKTGDLVYVQLINLFDNTILASGTTMLNGEMEVAIHYSQNGINYDLLFQHVMVQDKKSQILPWRIGDFNGDGVFNPNDSRDAGIVCNTNGTVLYGKITSTGFLDLLTAYNLAPDFGGYCEINNLSPNNNPPSDNNNPNDQGFNNNPPNNNSHTNNFCISDKINGNIKIYDKRSVYFEACSINGNVKIKYSEVKFIDSKINGNLKVKKSDLVIKGAEINGNVKVKGGSLDLRDTVINGNLKCYDTEYSIHFTTVKGNVEGCFLNESSDSNGNDDDDHNHHDGHHHDNDDDDNDELDE